MRGWDRSFLASAAEYLNFLAALFDFDRAFLQRRHNFFQFSAINIIQIKIESFLRELAVERFHSLPRHHRTKFYSGLQQDRWYSDIYIFFAVVLAGLMLHHDTKKFPPLALLGFRSCLGSGARMTDLQGFKKPLGIIGADFPSASICRICFLWLLIVALLF